MGDTAVNAATYLPGCLLRALSAQPGRSVPWCEEIEGTVVMADLSGFTPLSERLGRLGDEGAEQLTDITNSFFAHMLKTASRYGGDTINFGGDAILLMFRGRQHANRAVGASLAMLEQIARTGAVHSGDARVKLGMSVGAASGVFLLTAAGLQEERDHVFLLGRDAEMTALAESHAQRGQLVVSSATLNLLDGERTVSPAGPYWRVDQFSARGLPRIASSLPPPPDGHIPGLTPFLPSYLASATREDRGEGPQLAPEHRRVSAVFVNIVGFNELLGSAGAEAALEQLQAYCATLTRLLTKYGGFVLNTDIVTEGCKLLVTFGAPVAHEYAAANAARFALDLNAWMRRSGLSLQHRIGVNGGHMFAGEVGPSFRRQYTIMGDEANLAARMMSAAEPGQILATRVFAEQAGSAFCVRELSPMKVKGKAEPVRVCVLEGEDRRVVCAASSQEHGASFIGRRAELNTILKAWEQARDGRGGAVLVEGEAGVGKTRLVEETLDRMAAEGRIVRTHSYEHLQAFPLAPWVEVLNALLEISRHQSVEKRTSVAGHWLEKRVPDLLELAPLLNPLLALSFPMSDVVRSLDGMGRQNRLFYLVQRIVEAEARGKGLVLVFEDLHWTDVTSLDLLRAVADWVQGGRALLIATSRPSEVHLELGAAAHSLRLRELTKAESMRMVLSAPGIERLPPEVADTIYSKTRGNPLFLEEVIHALLAPGVLGAILEASSVDLSRRMAALAIPDRVQGLLMSRIDRLPVGAKEVIKVASVVGQTFDAETVRGIGDVIIERIPLDFAFRDLVAAGLTVADNSRTQSSAERVARSSYRFRHALVQEVTYKSLPFARRRNLHRQIARFLESVSEAPDHGLLVHHYLNAGDREELRTHAARAAQSSSAVYAYREGIDYLRLSLGTLTGRTPEHASMRSRMEEVAGDYLEALGRHQDAMKSYAKARERWRSPAARNAAVLSLADTFPVADPESRDCELCCKIAASAERRHDVYGRALRWLDEADKAIPPGNAVLASRTRIIRSLVYTRMGRYEDALALAEQSVKLAKEHNDASLEAHALTRLFVPCLELGLFARAMEASRRAVELCEDLGDIGAEAIARGNLAICYHATGDVKSALEQHQLARSLELRLGNSTGLAMSDNNIAELMLTMGRFGEALSHLEAVVRHCEENEAVGLMGIALMTSARVRVRMGELAEAPSAIAQAKGLLKKAQAEGVLLEAELVEAELDLAQQRRDDAVKKAQRALEGARAAKARLTELNALLFLGSLNIEREDFERAESQVDQSLEMAMGMEMVYEQGLAYFALARLRAASGKGPPREPLQEAIAIFERTSAEYDLRKAIELERLLRQDGR
jgi:class 3 adenylate cyclase/tetratricopeptide (TPR) repeat protein